MTLKERLERLGAEQVRRTMPDRDRWPLTQRPTMEDWNRLERLEVKLDWLIERAERAGGGGDGR